MHIRRRCLSLTQIRSYNSHPELYINGKLKGHRFIGICQGAEIDKNNTCLILSLLCKYFKYINLSGLSKLWGEMWWGYLLDISVFRFIESIHTKYSWLKWPKKCSVDILQISVDTVKIFLYNV